MVYRSGVEPVSRRKALAGMGAIAMGMALPPEIVSFLGRRPLKQASIIPADKGFDPSWLAGLRKRDKPEVSRGDDLRWIGMPVGGLCCGQVYLGGDGRLWHWDIFNQRGGGDTQGGHYAKPMEPSSPIEQGFSVTVADHEYPLTSEWVKDIEFEHRYPIGVVRYRIGSLLITLEAFSPFIPLATEDSSLPLTVMRYTLKNTGTEVLKGSLAGWLDNPVGEITKQAHRLVKATRHVTEPSFTALEHYARRKPAPSAEQVRPEIVFGDFEGDSYAPWTVEGDAFGAKPFLFSEVPDRKQPSKGRGKAFVNTHESRAGQESVQADTYVGKLTSPEFKIERKFINFLIGGGNHPGETCINLIVEGKVARSETGRNGNPLRAAFWDVRELEGKQARLEVVDSHRGGWGHITLDAITFSDQAWEELADAELLADFGSMTIGALAKGTAEANRVEVPFSLKPGASVTVAFFVSWFFPNLTDAADKYGALEGFEKWKKHYATRFRSSLGVGRFLHARKNDLIGNTLDFAKTWYDSTLPHWFLARTLIPVDCLATATALRFSNGRFYGWEGVYCCPGTCQHVWNYAQASARLFPDLERNAREHTDFGLAWQPDGTLFYRGEYGRHMAHDGQAGTIIRTFREHSICPDSTWLKKIWPRVKTSIQRLMKEDRNGDGVLDTWQYNTLDDAWAGEISWISSLYAAALRCGAEMAKDMGDTAFATELETKVNQCAKSIPDKLFNGEFFTMKRDPAQPQALGYGPGCHIDQVFGDSLLHQVGLTPILPKDKVRSALKALHKYNFAPDAGGYRNSMQAVLRGGRWYAMPGEPGLIMTTFPKGGAEASKGKGHPDWIVGYFNECMNGFEYQAAAHMIAEGMVDEGLTVVRALHDRYSPSKRNPYNEIECSDHYARSMASYGAFLTMCGFAYHGPHAHLGFAPKLSGPFKVPFLTGEAWGTFATDGHTCTLGVAYGKCALKSLELPLAEATRVAIDRKSIPFKSVKAAAGVRLTFAKAVILARGQVLNVS